MPSVGGEEVEKEGKEKEPGRSNARGNEETALFDIVNRKRRGAMHRQGAGASSRRRQRTRVPAEGALWRALIARARASRLAAPRARRRRIPASPRRRRGASTFAPRADRARRS